MIYNKVQILNIKLPFIEAIEHLKTDEDAIGCMCITQDKPCIITLNENKELKIIENNLFDVNVPLIERLLTIDNILSDEYYLIIKL